MARPRAVGDGAEGGELLAEGVAGWIGRVGLGCGGWIHTGEMRTRGQLLVG